MAIFFNWLPRAPRMSKMRQAPGHRSEEAPHSSSLLRTVHYDEEEEASDIEGDVAAIESISEEVAIRDSTFSVGGNIVAYGLQMLALIDCLKVL